MKIIETRKNVFKKDWVGTILDICDSSSMWFVAYLLGMATLILSIIFY